MINNKEHCVGDTCYVIYNNKLNKVIITTEINVKTKSLDVETIMDIRQLEENPSSIMRRIHNTEEDLYNVSIYPDKPENIDFTPIQGAFYGSSLYDSKEELLSDLAKSCP